MMYLYGFPGPSHGRAVPVPPNPGGRGLCEREPAAAAADPGMPGADLPPCPHRYFSPGFASCGGNVPSRVFSLYFPGDEPGFRCRRTLEMCSEFPPDCPEWKEAELVCPACLEFGTRRGRAAEFVESRLLSRDGAYFCPNCNERYASGTDLAGAAIASLRDALDDGEYLEVLVRMFEKATGVARVR